MCDSKLLGGGGVVEGIFVPGVEEQGVEVGGAG